MSKLTDLLKRYATHARPISLTHVEDLLRQEKFNGALTFHYRDGVPKLIEAGRPLTVAIDQSVQETSVVGLTAAKS